MTARRETPHLTNVVFEDVEEESWADDALKLWRAALGLRVLDNNARNVEPPCVVITERGIPEVAIVPVRPDGTLDIPRGVAWIARG